MACAVWCGIGHQELKAVATAARLDLLVGLVVKVFVSRAADPGFNSRFPPWEHFRVESYQRPRNWHTGGAWRSQSTLGLVGPVSVQCDRVR